MLVEERTSSVGSMDCCSLVPCGKHGAFDEPTFGLEGGDTNGNLGDFSVDEFRTYKRRKQSRLCSESSLHEDGSVSTEAADQLADQGHWRSVVPEHILQSLGLSGSGIHSCTLKALRSSPFGFTTISKNFASGNTAWVQESVNCQEDRQKIHPLLHREPKVADRSHSAVEELKGPTSGGSQDDPNTSDGSQDEPNNQENDHHVTELCQRVFLNAIVSEKFDLLCKLLSENFHGLKVDSFLDLSVINSRMKEGAYGQSPILFSADIQQVWRKFQKIGTELHFLAKSLSDMSQTSYCKQIEGLVHETREERKHKEINHVTLEQKDNVDLVTAKRFSYLESDQPTKPVQIETCGLDKFCTCRHCGDKADGKDCLVCDSCEEMYHVSCIEPAVEEIPPRSWYCASCTASGIESPPENFQVCERLTDTRTQTHGTGDEIVGEVLSDLEEMLDCSLGAKDGPQLSSGNRRLHCCKLCRIGEVGDQKFQICGHPLCPNKYYHIRCLTSRQLKSYGPCWYCPSCLCRACLTDQDDDKIVLCDGCDHAYHIYCMKPPRTSIPRGKWFCSRCDAGIQAIRRARRAFENLEKQQRKKHSRGSNEAVGSVDMLLNAAEKLKCEEKLAAIGRERQNKKLRIKKEKEKE